MVGGATSPSANGIGVELIRRFGTRLSDCAHRYIHFGDATQRHMSRNIHQAHVWIHRIRMALGRYNKVSFREVEAISHVSRVEAGEEYRTEMKDITIDGADVEELNITR